MVYDDRNVALAVRQLSQSPGRMALGPDGTNYKTLEKYSVEELSEIVRERLFSKTVPNDCYNAGQFPCINTTALMLHLGLSSDMEKRYRDFQEETVDMRNLHPMVYDDRNVALAVRQLSQSPGRNRVLKQAVCTFQPVCPRWNRCPADAFSHYSLEYRCA